MHDKQQWIGTLISFGILFLVLALRMRRMNRAQPMRIEQLWMLPAFFGAVVAVLFWVHPPQGIVRLYAALACAAGLGLGWYRGRHMHLGINLQTRAVCQQGTMAAMIFIFLLVGLRFVARRFAAELGVWQAETAVSVSDLLLALGFGFIAAQRVEMAARAHRLIAAAKVEAE
jgi:hypothetical protein